MKTLFMLVTLICSQAFAADPIIEDLKSNIATEKSKMDANLASVSAATAPWWETPSGSLAMANYYDAAEAIIEHFESASNSIVGIWTMKLGRAFRDHKECIFADVKHNECDYYLESEMRKVAVENSKLAFELSTNIMTSIVKIQKNLVLFIAPTTIDELNVEIEKKRQKIADRLKKANELHKANALYLQDRELYQAHR